MGNCPLLSYFCISKLAKDGRSSLILISSIHSDKIKENSLKT